MARIEWDAEGARFFETGIDRGMLYLPAVSGVAWNGLVKVAEAPAGGTPQEYYVDGQKYLGVSTLEEYTATVETVSMPREFLPCSGMLRLSPGLFARNQPSKPFSFSYRTLIGSDAQQPGDDYKIHIVYNATAKMPDHVRQTQSTGSNLKTYSWVLAAVPESVAKYKPTAHFVIDTRKIDIYLLQAIEEILYGYESGDPHLMTAAELAFMLEVGVSVTTAAVGMKKMSFHAEVNSYECGVSGAPKMKKMKTSGAGSPFSATKAGTGPKMKKMKVSGAGAALPTITAAPKMKKMTVSAAVTGYSAGSGGSKLKKFSAAAAVGAWSIVYRGGKSYTSGSSIGSYALTLTGWTGANPAAGDILFCAIRTSSQNAMTWGQSAGSTWTKLCDNEGDPKDGNYSYAIWYRVMQAGDTGPTFTWSTSGTTIISAFALKPFTGSTPLVLAETSAQVNAGTASSGVNAFDAAAATAAAPGRCSVVVFVGRSATGNGNGTPTFTAPPGWVASENLEGDASAGNPRMCAWSYRPGCPSGSIDPAAANWTDNQNNTWAFSGIQILVRTGP